MSLNYVLFRENSSSHEEEYLARGVDSAGNDNTFCTTDFPEATNLKFDTAAEGYAFAAEFPQLQHWRVGQR